MQTYSAQLADGRIQVEPLETAVPEPSADQILIRVRAAGMNRGEVLKLRTRPTTGARLGIEAAGEVVRTGPNVPQFKPGDRVMGRSLAAFSEYALIDRRDAMPIPAALSWVQAAAIPITWTVVYDMLVAQGHLKADEWLLVTGVSSGVGVAALQLAKTLGAHVVGTSRSAQKLTQLKSLGLDAAIQTGEVDLEQAIMAATGVQGVNLAVNIAGGSVFEACLKTLAVEGRLATVGYMDGVLTAPLDLNRLHAQRLTLFGVSTKHYGAAQREHIVQGLVRDVLPFFASGRLTPVIDRTFAFKELTAALAYMESNAQIGKIVIEGPGA